MNRNYKQKVKDFLKREGFYVILFLCVCLVAIVTTISYKQQKDTGTKEELTSESSQEISLDTEDSNVQSSEMQNAERVQKGTEEDKDKDNKKTSESNKDETAVSTTMQKVSFSKPLEGKLLRGYTYPKPVKTTEDTQRTIRGIDIEASIGTEVKSAEEGIIESASNNGVEDGVTVVIAHADGIKTKYSNLDSNLLVNVGEKVLKGSVIGLVGETSKIYARDTYGEHLNIQVLNANNEQEDPQKYFEY